ncbi:MAG: oligosaccharide flippase family protein [Cyclobacteriaceae bacterium]
MYSILNKKDSLTRKLPVSSSALFMISSMVVNGGNYFYNIWLGRKLGPVDFSEAGLLLTFLLVLSFAGMTFQLIASKFIIELEHNYRKWFVTGINKIAVYSGIFLSVILIIFSGQIRHFFHLQSQWSVVLFALAVPVYFLLSAERGYEQGSQQFSRLSVSYQIEIWSKFVTTIMLLYILRDLTGIAIATSILLSVFISKYFRRSNFPSEESIAIKLPKKLIRRILFFGAFTLGYELVQILINYGDLLIVKHYFDEYTAGLYTSLALTGRIIYFITWMMVMVAIPTILNKRKNGESYKSLMLSYVLAISCISGAIVLLSYLFPIQAINLLFGGEYLSFAPLLWKYALATAFFALANLFIYYFISTDTYWPVTIAALAIAVQGVLFLYNHEDIWSIVHIQMSCMAVLLAIQVAIYIIKEFFQRSSPPD